MTAMDEWIDYDYAVLRVVPRVELGAFVNVGVVLHARTLGYLGVRTLESDAELASRVVGVDLPLLERYLEGCRRICRGEVAGGPLALSPPSERFHWLTAPRSDVLQASAVHGGITRDPEATLEALFRRYVSVP